jgi:cytochrome c peroxidase
MTAPLIAICAGFDPPEDVGREGFSGDPADRYRFRTPSLRYVALRGVESTRALQPR